MMVSMTMMILDLKNFGLAKELGLTGYCDCSGGREAGVNVNSRFLAAETKKNCAIYCDGSPGSRILVRRKMMN